MTRCSRNNLLLARSYIIENFNKEKGKLLRDAFEVTGVSKKTLLDLYEEVKLLQLNEKVRKKELNTNNEEVRTYKGRERKFFRFRVDHLSINYKKGK